MTAYFVFRCVDDWIESHGPLPLPDVEPLLLGCEVVADVKDLQYARSALVLRGDIVTAEELRACPCGGGKAFRDCHGAGGEA